ncbi:hypothetical protein A2U01_0016507, partial [Trifolium medium]|nr:hypothetical protein [Trifolium medium]
MDFSPTSPETFTIEGPYIRKKCYLWHVFVSNGFVIVSGVDWHYKYWLQPIQAFGKRIDL